MEKKDSLIFYISHYQILKNLSDEDFGKLYKAFFEKQLGNEIDLPKELEIPFGLVNNQMVLDSKKYEEKCEKNKENGKKGGRPKKPKKANGFFENPNDNDNENDNDNDNGNENENDISSTPIAVVEEIENIPPTAIISERDGNERNKDENLFELVERIFGRPLGSTEIEKIMTWEDNEVTRYAIKQSELSRAFSVRYIETILECYKKENITTLVQAEEREKKFHENKSKSCKNRKSQYERNKDVLEQSRKLDEVAND